MKLRFFMTHHRKKSVRDKAIDKKWIYLERYTFHRQNVICLKRKKRLWEKYSPPTECGPSRKVRVPEI